MARNVPVAERTLKILTFVAEYVAVANSGGVTQPKNKSFEIVHECINDMLLAAKYNLLLVNAREIQPFLTEYQADKPLLPFLCN